ncbi:MAG: SpoIVB peptidase [Clostridia bacterium]|nr:SpoIVB peptidase [Clostridia bacterium]
MQSKRRLSAAAALVAALVASLLSGLSPTGAPSVVATAPLPLVVPGGQSIGVVVRSDGVSVAAEAVLVDRAGHRTRPAAQAGVRPGDVILRVDGRPVADTRTAARLIGAAAATGRPVTLTLRRDGREFEARVAPVWDARAGRYLIGLWIRDAARGVGTLSFYDPATGLFAALGHVVSDPDTGKPFPLREGRIVRAVVTGIDRDGRGAAGEKVAAFRAGSPPLGEFRRNTPFGVFGRLSSEPPPGPGAPVPIAAPDEVHPGPALLFTVLSGEDVEAYAVEIERAERQPRPAPKGILLRVTDPRLLAAAGGIVQGMSGSPILQDGRLAGVLTHVLVGDPAEGYAVYAYWMAEAAGLVAAPAGEAGGG